MHVCPAIPPESQYRQATEHGIFCRHARGLRAWAIWGLSRMFGSSAPKYPGGFGGPGTFRASKRGGGSGTRGTSYLVSIQMICSGSRAKWFHVKPAAPATAKQDFARLTGREAATPPSFCAGRGIHSLNTSQYVTSVCLCSRISDQGSRP